MNRNASRRQFLKLSGRTLGSLGMASMVSRFSSWNAFAAGPDYRALVCVYMFGGNDCNNMLIPMDSTRYDAYRRIRGPLALGTNAVRRIAPRDGSDYALHPGLTRVAQRFGEGKIALVANVGTLVGPTTRADLDNGATTPENLFSHSDQTSQMQAGVPGAYASGWGGRALDHVLSLNSGASFPGALSVTGESLFCVGETAETAGLGADSDLGINALNPPNEQDRQVRQAAFQEILRMDSGLSLVQEANKVMTKAGELDRLLREAQGDVVLQTQFPSTGLGQQLREVARFINLRNQFGLKRQVFFCGIGGFDTHDDQLPSQAQLMAEIDAAVDAFYRATIEMTVQDSVTLFTESEFGRTLNPNRNGTDHAWGSHHLVLGGAVRGGDLYGRYPTLQLRGPDDAGDRGIWIPTTSLAQYGATLARWFGVAEADLDAVFPNLRNFSARDIGFMPAV